MSVRQILQTDPETLQHLELAADARLTEASELLARGHATASVYLAGFAAEMTLKTATFRVEGAGPGDLVAPRLHAARARARLLIGNIDDESFHSILFWGLLLRETRRYRKRPLGGSLAQELVRRAEFIHAWWGVDMRYRPRLLGPEDAKKVIQHVGWLRTRARDLWR